MKFKTISQVWDAIYQGKKVYWCSDAYQLTIEETNIEWRERLHFEIYLHV